MTVGEYLVAVRNNKLFREWKEQETEHKKLFREWNKLRMKKFIKERTNGK